MYIDVTENSALKTQPLGLSIARVTAGQELASRKARIKQIVIMLRLGVLSDAAANARNRPAEHAGRTTVDRRG